MVWRALASPYQLSNFIGLLKERQLCVSGETEEDMPRAFYHLWCVFVNQMFMHSCLFKLSLSSFAWQWVEKTMCCSSLLVFLFIVFYFGKCQAETMNGFNSVYSSLMYCAINARRLPHSLTVTRPGVDCVQVTLTLHLSAFQEVFSDWRSVVWYIYGDFCADRCIVFIVTFLYWIWSPTAC